jgi:hypothetical protein
MILGYFLTASEDPVAAVGTIRTVHLIIPSGMVGMMMIRFARHELNKYHD